MSLLSSWPASAGLPELEGEERVKLEQAREQLVLSAHAETLKPQVGRALARPMRRNLLAVSGCL